MSKTIAKKVMLLSMGAMFAFPFVGGPGDMGCVRNDNLVGFYQAVGTAAINDLAETALDTAPAIGNFGNLIVAPTQAFWTSAYDNWVAQQFPLDLDVSGVVKE